MKIAVYNKYWSTAGGGEKYGGSMADLLSRDHTVDLLVHEHFDAEALSERLNLDLTRTRQVAVRGRIGAVGEASTDYDLFLNVSYMSADHSQAPHGLYVVYFPSSPVAHLSRVQRLGGKVLRDLPGGVPVSMGWGLGFYPRDQGRRGGLWTNGDACLYFTTDPRRPVPIELRFGFQRPAEVADVDVVIEVDGTQVAGAHLGRPRSRVEAVMGVPVRFEVCSPEADVPVEVHLRSDTFIPGEVLGTSDTRELGVPIITIRAGTGAQGLISAAMPSTLHPIGRRHKWIDTYDELLSISEFTRTWVKRYWDVDSEILYPPVTMHDRGDKEPIVLGVGRFFERHEGHSKKQLEMVKTFRRLCDRGLEGWSLHLVGGCEERAVPYVGEVRRTAAGYPVELHINASGAALRALYRRASLYWHATGVGEHRERHPERMEHFGITTVEAMSAGAVPIVHAAAGQLETVRHGVDGFHFRSLDELCDLTAMLVGDPPTLARLSAAAEARASQFSLDAFDDRLHGIVERVMAGR